MLGYPMTFGPATGSCARIVTAPRRSTGRWTTVFASQIGDAPSVRAQRRGTHRSRRRADEGRRAAHAGAAQARSRRRMPISSSCGWSGSSLVLTGGGDPVPAQPGAADRAIGARRGSFGKGRAVPDFKPYGATEVRRAAQAFLTMRERIERYVQQRTEMLAGVSHDLKTPLTRLKLEIAMMGGGIDTRAMKRRHRRDGAHARRISRFRARRGRRGIAGRRSRRHRARRRRCRKPCPQRRRRPAHGARPSPVS